MGFFSLKLSFQPGYRSIAKFRNAIEIVFAFGFFNLVLQVFKLLPDLLQSPDGGFLRFPLLFQCGAFSTLVLKFIFQRCESRLTAGILLLFEGFPFNFELQNLSGHLVQFGGHAIDLRTKSRGGFIDEIDGLVRKKPVANISMREPCGCNQSRVFDADPMMNFVPFLEPPQNRNRVFHRWLFHEHGLETALERRIFFNMLSIFIQGRGPDQVEFSPGKHWFEQVGGVHGPFCRSRAHDGVQLVDKKEDLALRRLNFF